jgi:glutamate racemase
MISPNNSSPIGLFDSGVGGLSVLSPLRKMLPNENYLYFADQINIPYGPRSKDEVLSFSEAITRFLLKNDSKLIVVACNTASAAALQTLRKDQPDVLFVGMEPAVKPAVQQSKTGVVGVLATPSTFEGDLYASVVERFAGEAKLLKATCLGLVEEIEAGRANGEAAIRILNRALQPMLSQTIDAVVLGCTHYPFAFETIRQIVGPDVDLIDPAPAIAHRVASLLLENNLLTSNTSVGSTRFLSTGESSALQTRIKELLHESANVESMDWKNGKIVSKN